MNTLKLIAFYIWATGVIFGYLYLAWLITGGH
jgi:hypothetical protein